MILCLDHRTHKRTNNMPAKLTAPKKTKPGNPSLRITTTADVGETGLHFLLVASLTAKQMKEALRARKLPIPKDKQTMASRLRRHLSDRKSALTLDIAG